MVSGQVVGDDQDKRRTLSSLLLAASMVAHEIRLRKRT